MKSALKKELKVIFLFYKYARFSGSILLFESSFLCVFMRKADKIDLSKIDVIDSFELEKVSYYFTKEGITYIVFKPNSSIELQDSLNELKQLEKRKEQWPLYAIVSIGEVSTISEESREFWMTGEGKGVFAAQAAITDSTSLRIIHIIVRKRLDRTLRIKMFKSLKNAENWLRGIRLIK